MSDYAVEIRIRNGPLRRAMREVGLTGSELARRAGVRPGVVSRYLLLKDAPILKNGELSENILKIAGVLRQLPEDLFPPQHMQKTLDRGVAEIEMSIEDVQQIVGPHYDEPLELIDMRNVIEKSLERLSPRYRECVEGYYGLNGESEKTLSEMAEEFDLSRGRVWQILQSAEKKLKDPWSPLRDKDIQDSVRARRGSVPLPIK